MASEDRFGYEWGKYNALDPKYKEQFDNWIGPLSAKDFEGKNVLDAGCGMGRNSFWALSYGAKHVTAFDYDRRSVEAAKSNLKNFKNVDVLFKNIYTLNWENKFDLALCIGVKHHLKNPKLAIQNIMKSLVGGGVLVSWVYSYEGNEWIVRFINPFREIITSKLPVRAVDGLSYLFSVPLWIFIKIFRGPTPYLKMLSSFKFWHVHSIVFDQLIPEISHYWTKAEAEQLFRSAGVEKLEIYEPKNKSGWVIISRK